MKLKVIDKTQIENNVLRARVQELEETLSHVKDMIEKWKDDEEYWQVKVKRA